MPLFIDRHDIQDATARDLAVAHMRDLEVQGDFDVRFVTYWFDDVAGSGFCLVESPDKDSVEAAHRAAHGLMPSNVIEVDQVAVRGFFGKLNTHPAGEAYIDSAFRTILFTDIVESTRMAQERGDNEAMKVLHVHDSIVRNAIAKFGGTEVKHTGDGIMAAFASAFQAVAAATEIQRDLGRHEAGAAGDLQLRVGIAAGEPVTEHDDLFGAAVQQAARLCSCAEPNGIVVSSGVRDLCRGKPVTFSEERRAQLKGFAEPLAHFEVAWQE